MTRPRVAFLQTKEDAVHPLARQADVSIAMLPPAAAVLEKEGRTYRLLSEFSRASDGWTLARAAQERQSKWVDRVDEALQEDIPAFRMADFRPARANIYRIINLVETIEWYGHVLDRTLATLEPSEIIVRPARRAGRGLPRSPFLPERLSRLFDGLGDRLGVLPRMGEEIFFEEESPFSLLLPLLASMRGIHFRPLGRPPLLRSKHPPFVFEPCDETVGRTPNGGWLFLFDGYDAPYLREACRREKILTVHVREVIRWRPCSISPPSIAASCRKTGERLSTDPFFGRILGDKAAALRPAAEDRMRYWFEQIVPILWARFEAARGILRRLRPEVVIGGCLCQGEEYAFIPAARAEGIPTAYLPHGPTGFINEYGARIVAPADRYLVYGEGARESVDMVTIQDRVRSVGSPRLDALRAEFEREHAARRANGRAHRPSCLFISTCTQWKVRRLSEMVMNPVEHWRFQRRLLSLFSRFPEIDFFWRPFPPPCWIDPVELGIPVPSHVRIARTRTASQLIPFADAIFLDDASTPILEAALTRVPLLALANREVWESPPRLIERMERRARIFSDPEAFLRGAEEFLSAGDFRSVEAPDESYVRDFGIHLGDGCSAERAVEAIRDLVAARGRRQA